MSSIQWHIHKNMAAAKKQCTYDSTFMTFGTENNISVLAQTGRNKYTKEHDGILRGDGIVLHTNYGDGYKIVSVKTHSILHSKRAHFTICKL